MPYTIRKHNEHTQQEGKTGFRSTSGRKAKAKAAQQLSFRPKNPTVSKNKIQLSYYLRSSQQHRSHCGRHRKKPEIGANHRELHPEKYPDLDFHHSFGSFLTRKNTVSSTVDPKIAWYWDLLSKTPTLLQHHIHDIGDRYRDAFRELFTAEPISLHGHVSDASNPALLTSLISHLVSHASSTCKFPLFDEDDRTNARLAIVGGSYGAGYGPLAYDAVIDSVRPLANGLRPVLIKTNIAAKIDAQVKKAKSMGCVALITEIVQSRDGKVISESAWKNVLKACERYGVMLVVDEALTSIRCGAPFAYQLPQYCKHGLPDLILFGKAVRTNGIAVEWRGINIRKLGIADPEDRLFTVLDWQERLTEMAQAADLLISWGTLVLAKKEQWPQRAQEIGQVLRDILVSDGIKNSYISGLHGLIYLRLQDNVRFSSPVMGAKAGNHVRWFPVMDTVMTSQKELRAKVFGPGSNSHRKDVSAYLRSQNLRLGFCSRCGNAVGVDVRTCEVCVVRVCEECEPGEHMCPMER